MFLSSRVATFEELSPKAQVQVGTVRSAGGTGSVMADIRSHFGILARRWAA